MDILIAIIWASALVVVTHRVTAVWERVTQKAAFPPLASLPTMPTDLMALALAEQDQWAQEDVQKVIWERYHDLGDWNLVRQAVGIGRMP